MTASPLTRGLQLVSGLLRRAAFGRVPRLFDDPYYRARNPGVARSGIDPFLHYLLVGARRGHNPNADFDTAFYRAQSGRTRLDPLRHYLRVGAGRGLDPNPGFSTSLYLARYPDVVRAGLNPLQHYRSDGRAEGREAAPSALAADRLRALDGVPPEHLRLYPATAGGRYELRWLRTAGHGSTEFAPRLCLQLCLDGPAFDAVRAAAAAFETGAQDEIALRIDAGAGSTPPVPTQLLAFERAFLMPSPDGDGLILRYAELRIWDLRGRRAAVAAVHPGGAFAARRADPREAWEGAQPT